MDVGELERPVCFCIGQARLKWQQPVGRLKKSQGPYNGASCMRKSSRRAPLFDSWAELWEAIADWAGSRRHILILDELPYAIESDPATLSALPHVWDQRFQNSNLVIVLGGSQAKVLESILYQQSPLFGRLTGQWHLQPLLFASLREFYPSYSAEERVALYAMVGPKVAKMLLANSKSHRSQLSKSR